jgi:anti-anti-sigma factor
MLERAKAKKGDNMEISTAEKNNTVILSVKGRMDAVTSPQFDKAFLDLVAQGNRSFLLNMDSLEYISSAGLRSILAAAKQLKEKQGTILFAGLHGPVEEVFKISGFYSIFQVFGSEEDALAHL